MLSIIAAISKNNVIGEENRIPWDLPIDREMFRKLTMNHTIIMGRKTFESLKSVLPNRESIVFSKNEAYKVNHPNVKTVHHIEDIQELIQSWEEVFVIGGAEIYGMLLKYTKKMYITKIKNEFEGDTFFPEYDENEWQIINRRMGMRDEVNQLDYEFIQMVRISRGCEIE